MVHDQAFFDALVTPHKRFTPTCDHETYLRLLGGCEICFMPLADTPFNRAKSDLKFIEAGAARCAAVASETVYGNTIENGRTGLIFRNEAELREALLRLISAPDLGRLWATPRGPMSRGNGCWRIRQRLGSPGTASCGSAGRS